MQLTINGKDEYIEGATALSDVLQHLQLEGDGVAIAVNNAVVPRAKWDRTQLRDGDAIEIIHAVQGG
jgi:sulfur carrier protein